MVAKRSALALAASLAGALAGAIASAPDARAAAGGAVLRVCAGGHPGFSIGPDPLSGGSIVVPRDAVFRFAGMPLDLSLGRHGGAGEPSDHLPARAGGTVHGFGRGLDDNPALVTAGSIRLTRAARCGAVPAAALLSPRFGWSTAPVKGTGRLRFKPYGTVRNGHLSLGYAGAEAAFRRAAIRGEIVATFRGETTRTVRLAKRDLDVIAHHRRHRHR